MSGHTLIETAVATPDVRVNGTLIEPEAIAAEAQHHPSDSPEAAWKAAAEALVIRESLLQAARARELSVEVGEHEDPDEALIRALTEQEISVPEPDEESCRRYFANNRERFRPADIYEPAHILLQADSKDAIAYDAVRADTRALIAHLKLHPDHFDRLAREMSACNSSADGGRLGQVARGETTPAFEAAMLALSAGELTEEPVETPYGFHIIRLDRKRVGELPEFEEARPLIEDFLRDASWRRAVAQFVSLVVGEAKIEGVELHGANSPLVQ
ncbi:peptidylprolyl isomerase [Maricaulis sp.]|uniref:peptidylprolyl isomerase n=1 Tax=Maricaulis sp. TaxID=1486257 RepID=UPI002604D368|nr:peptidylprolyl isomerase [Maricaulis sp.]